MSDVEIVSITTDPVLSVTMTPFDPQARPYSSGRMGPPLTGTWKKNAQAIDLMGQTWVCIAGGAPGDWIPARSAAKPNPMGSTLALLSDSIGAGVNGASTGPFTDSRMNANAWFWRMCWANPNRYYPLRNGGIGGDTVGCYGFLTAQAEIGATSVTYAIARGSVPFGNNPIRVGATSDSTSEGRTHSVTVDNGNGTVTTTFTGGGLTKVWPVGTKFCVGMLGRLSSDVIAFGPEICLIHAGTNSLNSKTPAQISSDVMDIVTDCRLAGIEPVVLEILPRSSYMDQVVLTNDALRRACRVYPGGSVHCIPTYSAFAGSNGQFANAADHVDGLHPSPTGNIKLANLVGAYLDQLPLRISRVPLAAYNDDPTNLIAKSTFLNKVSAGGYGFSPEGWTFSPFFAAGMTIDCVAPGVNDGLVGNWLTMNATAGNTGNMACQIPLSTAPAIGDLLLLSVRMRTNAGFTGTPHSSAQFLTGTFPIDLVYQLTEPGRDDVIMNTITRVASNTLNAFALRIDPGGDACQVQFGQPFAQNLTTLGRAA